MAKSLRMIDEHVAAVDAVFYVLDARAPASCLNPQFDRALEKKPVVYLLNKADLAEPAVTAAWERALTGERARAVSLNAGVSKSAAALLPLIRTLCAAKLEKYRSKGANATLKAMVLGVPNTGKSTVVNNLCGKYKTVTGDRPGVTRGKQWVRVAPYLELLDTPGTLYPKFIDRTTAWRLCFIGSVKDEIVDTGELARRLIEELTAGHAGRLQKRYEADEAQASAVVLEQIAKARGFLLKGGESDADRAAAALIDDFRKGRLGRISLERPEAAV
jgi:ribosome biogenesis GTPase A